MSPPKPGTGSAYTWAYRDAPGTWLDPARTYRLRLPAPVPAKNFWSVVVYDLWTRSMLANGQPYPSVSTYATGLSTNATGRSTSTADPSPEGAGQLDPHPARHRMVPHPPLLRGKALVRPELEARRPGTRRPGPVSTSGMIEPRRPRMGPHPGRQVAVE